MRAFLNSTFALMMLAALAACGGSGMQKKATRAANAGGSGAQQEGQGQEKLDFDEVDADSGELPAMPVAINHAQRECPTLLNSGERTFRLPNDRKRRVTFGKDNGGIVIHDSNLVGSAVTGGNARRFRWTHAGKKSMFYTFAGCEQGKVHMIRWSYYGRDAKVSLKDATYEFSANGELTVKTNTKEDGKPDQSATENLKQ